jgi:hypothetical protein
MSDWGIIQPPSTFTVDHERKPVLYQPDGTPLVKRPVGFDTRPTTPSPHLSSPGGEQ